MQAVSAFHVSMTLQRCLKPLTSTLRTFSLLLLWQWSRDGATVTKVILRTHKLKIRCHHGTYNIPGDRNGLFTSVAFSLVQRIQSGDAFIIKHLRDIGIHEIHMQDTNYIQKILRMQMVEEWNTNQEYYQGFLTVDT